MRAFPARHRGPRQPWDPRADRPRPIRMGSFVGVRARNPLPAITSAPHPQTSNPGFQGRSPRLRPSPALTSIQRETNRGVRFNLALQSRFRALCGPFAVPIPRVCHRVRAYVGRRLPHDPRPSPVDSRVAALPSATTDRTVSDRPRRQSNDGLIGQFSLRSDDYATALRSPAMS